MPIPEREKIAANWLGRADIAQARRPSRVWGQDQR